MCLRSHGRSENYDTTWWTDFKTRRFLSRNLLERSFDMTLSFGTIYFNLLVLHFLARVTLHRGILLLRFSALLFKIFLHTRISKFPFYFQFVIDLIFSSIFCNRTWVILHQRHQLLRFSALRFAIFLHTRISQFTFYFQFVIDLIFSSIFCNRKKLDNYLFAFNEQICTSLLMFFFNF